MERGQELLDDVANGLFAVGVSLQDAIHQPHDVARARITDALQRLERTIREIRDHIFATRHPGNGARSPTV